LMTIARSFSGVADNAGMQLHQIKHSGINKGYLVVPGNPDLRKSFDSYSDNLARLEKEGIRVNKQAEELKSQCKEYFAEWKKRGDTFTNPEIRKLSAKRRNN